MTRSSGRQHGRVAAADMGAGPFGPVEQRASLPDEVAARIAAEIEAGRLAPGSQLPPEHVLIASFGISRTTLREAVSALRAAGLIVTQHGRGSFVADAALRKPFRIDPAELRSLADVLHVIELRASVEIEAAALAALRRRQHHLDRLAAILAEMDAAIARGESAVEIDFEFHRAVAEATGNPYFRRFLDHLGPLVIPRRNMAPGLNEPGVDRRLYLRRIQEEHRAIEAAIVAGDAAAARRAARQHLDRGRERYGLEHDTSNGAGGPDFGPS